MKTPFRVLAIAFAVVFVVGACTSTKGKVSAKKFVSQACSIKAPLGEGILSFQDALTNKSAQFVNQATGEVDVPGLQELLINETQTLLALIEEAANDIGNLSEPDVPDGKKYLDGQRKESDQLVSEVRDAVKGLKAIDTDDPNEFNNQVQKVFNGIESAETKEEPGVLFEESDELEKASKGVKSCDSARDVDEQLSGGAQQ